MGHARNRRRLEVKELRKERAAGEGIDVPLVITFKDVGTDQQRVVLYCSEQEDPSESELVAEMPVRGELPITRKEAIVLRFAALFTTCLTLPGEGPDGWAIARSTFQKYNRSKKSAKAKNEPEPAAPRTRSNLWPEFEKK
jgi:hypothetical protein